MDKVHAFLNHVFWGMPVYCWLVLASIGLINEIIARSPRVRAMTFFQIYMNVLKASPLGRFPLIGSALEKLDTPEPTREELLAQLEKLDATEKARRIVENLVPAAEHKIDDTPIEKPVPKVDPPKEG